MMTKFDLKAVWADIRAYRQVYFLTAVASFGGMLFGWDTGLIGMCCSLQPPLHQLIMGTGGVLTMDAFRHSFNLDKNSPDFSNLQGNIVSVLQVSIVKAK